MLRKGSILVCPECDAIVAQSRRDILPKQRLRASDVEGKQGVTLTPQTHVQCLRCGYDFTQIEVFTPKCWVPPQINEVING